MKKKSKRKQDRSVLKGLTPQDRKRIRIAVVEMKMKKVLVKHIVSAIERDYRLEINAQAVYDVIGEALSDGTALITAPLEDRLARNLRRYVNKGDVQVALVDPEWSTDYLAKAAAVTVFDLIKMLAKQRKGGPVHLGVGIGRTTLFFMLRLVQLLHSHKPLALVIHALTTPDSPEDPLETPFAWYAMLKQACPNVVFVPLRGEPMVRAAEHSAVKQHKFVKTAFDRREEIDIIVTSLASSRDEHGYLRRFLELGDDPQSIRELKQQGWVGDVHLLPYGKHGPLHTKDGLKPVTLFDLEDLVRLAHTRGKHVVLVGGPCGKCNEPKTEALLPLMCEPSLHIWNHLILDIHTANALLDFKPRAASAPASQVSSQQLPTKVITPLAPEAKPSKTKEQSKRKAGRKKA